MTALATPPKLQFLDANGAPLVGGKLYTYAAGTTTPLATYTDFGGGTPNANPVILDSRGEASVWLGTALYKMALYDSTNVLVWTVDNIGGFATLAQLAASGGSNLVGFLQAGTGAVATTVQTKLRESVSVKDFGAVGDGVTDDTAAIQLALNSGVPYVLLPPGTYLVTATLTIASANITLAGQSGGTQAYQTATINHSASSTGPLFSLNSSSNGGACLRNFNVTGGNGSFCIVSSRPYVRYEYIHMEPYNGGGIQLLYTSGGSSSSEINQCQWVGPASASAYTAFEIDVNGGDVAINHCTAIRGAIGLNIIRGQTIIVNRFSANKQTRNPFVSGGPYSNATQFNTAAIKLSGSGLKQAISIRNSYIEVCDNSIYVESCESLSIEDNLIDDGGAAGITGTWLAYGNSAIYLADATCKNITIKNNDIQSNSAGSVTSVATNWFALRLNSASNVIVLNNYISTTGDYSAAYYVTTSQSVYTLGNTQVPSSSFPVSNYDPNVYIRTLLSSNITSAWAATTAAAGWTNTSGRYFKNAFGFVSLSGQMAGGTGLMTTLPAGFTPAQQESFVVNASGALGVVTVFTNGQVSFTSGTATFVYLSNITFSTT
jgi:hypothetical protein